MAMKVQVQLISALKFVWFCRNSN